MKLILAIVLTSLAVCSIAGEMRHRKLAEEFDQLAVDRNKAIAKIVDETIAVAPHLAESRADLATQLLKFSESQPAVEQRTREYMNSFTEAELEQLVPLLKSPAYKLLMDREFQVRNPFYTGFIRFKPSFPKK